MDYTNIFVACAEACKRHSIKQSDFVNRVKSLILPEGNEDDFVMVLARFNKTFAKREDGTGSTFLLDLNGCLVLQHILDFHKPSKVSVLNLDHQELKAIFRSSVFLLNNNLFTQVVKNMLGMDTREIFKLATDPKGSHIMDSFFKSETVGEKSKEKMLVKLKVMINRF